MIHLTTPTPCRIKSEVPQLNQQGLGTERLGEGVHGHGDMLFFLFQPRTGGTEKITKRPFFVSTKMT